MNPQFRPTGFAMPAHAEMFGASVYALLRRLGPHGGARCIPVAEYLDCRSRGRLDLQRRFYAGLLLRNGVYKTTHPNRMNELFPMLISMSRDLRPHPLRVLDVACSSGISTMEMRGAFDRAGVPCEAWGTDLMISARHVLRDDGCAILFDPDSEPIQIEIGRWATPWRLRPRDRLLRPRRYAQARQLLDHEVDAFRAALDGRAAGFTVTEVSLLSSATDGVPGVHYVQEDILRPKVPGPFAVIRAANLLNLGYFTPEMIREMVAALCGRLQEGGLLLVTRTEGPELTNLGTMFRWIGGKLEVEVTTNGGSEITDLVS